MLSPKNLQFTPRQLFFKLSNQFQPNEQQLQLLKILLAHQLRCGLSDLLLRFDQLCPISYSLLQQQMQKIMMHYPWQYLCQKVIFYDLKFKILPGVFIPRPETEVLVTKAKQYLQNKSRSQIKKMNFADVCTGSGVIGISLLREFNFRKSFFIDISAKALKLAHFNAKKMLSVQQQKQIIYWCCDGLKALLTHSKKISILLSNPPYIDIHDKNIDSDVIAFQPVKALFSPQNGLQFYYRLIKNIARIMTKNFYICFEINWFSYLELKQYLEASCLTYKWAFSQDEYEKWRYLEIWN